MVLLFYMIMNNVSFETKLDIGDNQDFYNKVQKKEANLERAEKRKRFLEEE